MTIETDLFQFNERIFLDIMYIESVLVLHIVHEGTRFSAARFLSRACTEELKTTLVLFRPLVYTGLPKRILTDQGSQCFSISFKLQQNLT